MNRPTDRAGELVAGRVAAASLLAGRARGACVCTGACLCDPQPARCRAVAGELRCELRAGHEGAHGAWRIEERGVYNFAVRALWPAAPAAGGRGEDEPAPSPLPTTRGQGPFMALVDRIRERAEREPEARLALRSVAAELEDMVQVVRNREVWW